MIFVLAPGALLTMGMLLAFFNWFGSIDIKKQMSHILKHNPKHAEEETVTVAAPEKLEVKA
jgi:hypothetical protein